MDEFGFVKFMERRKEEKKKRVENLKERDVVKEILKEIGDFEKRGKNSIFLFYGLRGIGKTTSLFQSMRKREGMFIDGDVLSYYELGLVEVVEEYLRNSESKLLFIDEVNSIERWGHALKVIYDNYDVKVIATGSSAIKLNIENSKIVRRANFMEIPPLTFREYLRIRYGEEIRQSKEEVRDVFLSSPEDAYVKAKAVLFKLRDYTKEFREYIRNGLPLMFEMEKEKAVDALVSKIISDDFSGIEGFNLNTVANARKIIEAIAVAKPSHISLDSFAKLTGNSKTTISNILKAFVMSSLLLEVKPHRKGVTKLRKESKYLFSSPAVRSGISSMLGEENIGGMREDAFVSAVKFSGMNIEYLRKEGEADYVVEGNVFEIGRKSKGIEQVRRGFVLVDGNKVDFVKGKVVLPLFLAGLM